MCQCQIRGSCFGCQYGLDRRRFLGGLGASAAAAVGWPSAVRSAENHPDDKVRVAAVFLANANIREIWPYPGFDTQGRQREILGRLTEGCPGVEYVPVTIEQAAEVDKAIALKDKVDGYLVYVLTLDWRFRGPILQLGRLNKPMIVANEFLGGCGVFLTSCSALTPQGIAATAISTTRLQDLVTVARQFADVRQPGTTPASFARKCQEAYRQTFGMSKSGGCAEDPVKLRDIGESVRRFRQSRFLIVGRGKPGQEQQFLGAKAIHVDFDELRALYEQVDQDEAKEWADRWTNAADRVVEPKSEPIRKGAAIYLATLKLLEKYGTDSVTMNCLGGFNAGKLPAYPCLGFMQLLNDGGQGVCEAMPDDSVSMLMARILTGRPGYVSDPALDTSRNQVVYAHCVATTRAFGPQGEANGYRIRNLHNRDPRGACVESFLPPGYMTTSFRTNLSRKQMVIHQAKSMGSLDSESGCRTKLIAEVRGDIGRLFDQWSRFSWHRVTVYGDVKEPLTEFAKALGLKVVHEA